MAAASDAEVVLADPPASPTLVVHPRRAGHRCAGATHSTVADGRLVCWSPDTAARVAVDAEGCGATVPPALARRWATSDPAVVWPAWCLLECLAKLTDTPVLLLARGGPPAGANPVPTPAGWVHWRRDRVGDLVVVRAVLSPTTS